MIRLECLTMNSGWVSVGEFPNEKVAWITLGGDDINYRTVDKETGKVLTDKSLLKKGNKQ